MPTARLLLLSAALAAPPGLAAGVWDADTRFLSDRPLPADRELIAGKFARHSRGFYEDRAARRRAALLLDDTGETPLAPAELAAAYDDLAAALIHLGDPAEALRVLDEKGAAAPGEAPFATAANRAAAHWAAGDYERSAAADRAAAAVLEGRDDPLSDAESLWLTAVRTRAALADHLHDGLDDGEPFVARDSAAALAARGVDAGEALRGVRFLLRFGDHRGPVLLAALGDLLRAGGAPGGSAARAYLAAARHADGPAGDLLRDRAAEAVGGPDAAAELDAALAREIGETDKWFAKVEEDEAMWAEKSLDPDARWREKYGVAVLKLGDVTSRPARIQGHWAARGLQWWMTGFVFVGGTLTLLGVWALVRWRARQPSGWGA